MVSVIFNFINVGLLILILLVVFKKYIYPDLKKALKENLNNKAKLRHKKEELQSMQILLDREIKNQDKRCKELMQKVNLWEEQTGIAQNLKESKQWAYYQEIKEKILIQESNYKEYKLKKSVTPYVEKQLQKSLEDYYSYDSNQEKYFENIINYIEKSN